MKRLSTLFATVFTLAGCTEESTPADEGTTTDVGSDEGSSSSEGDEDTGDIPGDVPDDSEPQEQCIENDWYAYDPEAQAYLSVRGFTVITAAFL